MIRLMFKDVTNRRVIYLLAAVILIGAVIFSVWNFREKCGEGSGKQQFIDDKSPLASGKRISYDCWGRMERVTGVILHYTETSTFEQALSVLEAQQLFVQIMIDKDGKAYQLTDNLDDFAAGATGGNSWGISIEIVGNRESLLESAQSQDDQFRSVVAVVKYLAERYGIPLNNDMPADGSMLWYGIFSHEQVDNFHPKGGRHGKVDPGGEYMRAIMDSL